MRRMILQVMVLMLLCTMLWVPSIYAVPLKAMDYNSMFFEDAEVFVDRDGDRAISVGDTFWGVFNIQNMKAPTDPSGQIGPTS